MTCAYSQSDNYKCQFEIQENELMEVDGKQWCPFHAPLKDQTGNPTEKGKWLGIQIHAFNAQILELSQNALKGSVELNLSGVIFPGDIIFQNTEFPNVNFSYAKFKGDVDFSGAKFSGSFVNFRHVRFLASNPKFIDGKANFRGVEFPEADFFDTRFYHGHADFRDAKFTKGADFRNAEFKEYADFSGNTIFEVSADFRETKFKGRLANFSGARFIDSGTSFRGAEFTEVNFSRAQFISKDADSRDAELKRNVDFPNAEFSRLLPKFSDVDFQDARFGWKSDFSHTIFSGLSANFYGAKFTNQDTLFSHARFKRSANFQNTQFSGRVNFEKARFKATADFTSPGNNDDVDTFQGEVDFEGTEFLDEVNFNNRNFQQATDFRDSTFHKAPRFHGCLLHQETDFTDSRFLDTTSPGSAMAYRTLKLDMEEKRARQEQLRFYALEMKSRRHAEKRKLVKFLSWLYEKTSDYGQSVSRPLLWLGGLLLVFAIIYRSFFVALLIDCLKNTEIWLLSLRFSVEQIISPFSTFNLSSLFQLLGKDAPNISLSPICLLLLRLIAALQSFLSLVLLLLSVLAARWRFKIG